jgi:hypothetical protein
MFHFIIKQEVMEIGIAVTIKPTKALGTKV